MSHFSSVLCKLNNKDFLIQALNEQPEVLKVLDQEDAYVRGYSGRKAESDLVAVLDGEYDIGFVTTPDGVFAIADWGYGSCTQGNERESLSKLWQRVIASYSRIEALSVINKTTQSNPNVSVVLHE